MRERPIRVAIDLTPLLPGGGNGGVKPFIREQIKWLGAQSRQPLVFLFITRQSSHHEVREWGRSSDEFVCILMDGGSADHMAPGCLPRERVAIPAPLDLLDQYRSDLLYAPFGLANQFFPGIPVISLIVDVLHREYPATLSYAAIYERERVFEECVAVTDRFQCISNQTIEALCRHYPVRRSSCFRTHIVIQNRLQNSSLAAPERHHATPYFLFPANAWPHKNHQTLLVGYRKYCVEAGVSAWDLVLTGHDDLAMREVLEIAETLGIGDKVHYRGHVAESEFVRIWQQASALLFPSLYEGFGIPLLEAMKMEVPILCGTHGALLEVAGDACLTVDTRKPNAIAAGLLKLANDPNGREALVKAGRERLMQFSFEQEANRLLETMIDLSESGGVAVQKGIDGDGWIGPLAAVKIPSRERLMVRFVFAAIAHSSRCRVYSGGWLFAEWRIPSGTQVERVIDFTPPVNRLLLEAPDALPGDEADPRMKGLRLIAIHAKRPETDWSPLWTSEIMP